MTKTIKPKNERLPVPEPDYLTHPGEFLKLDFLDEYHLTPEAFAIHIGVAPQVINDLVHEQGSITADLALRLERALGMPAQFWLNAQHGYDDVREIKRLRDSGEIQSIQPVIALSSQ